MAVTPPLTPRCSPRSPRRRCVALELASLGGLVGFVAVLLTLGPGQRLATAEPGWHVPLAGRPEVVRGFDPPLRPYGPGHRGVDLAGAAGQPVLAAGPGRVGYVGTIDRRGVVTVLHAGGLRTTYEPVRGMARPGQPVTAGDVLGVLAGGHPGCPRSACLHWGALRGTRYVDPLTLLGVDGGQIRLLPLGEVPACGFRAGSRRSGDTGDTRCPPAVPAPPGDVDRATGTDLAAPSAMPSRAPGQHGAPNEAVTQRPVSHEVPWHWQQPGQVTATGLAAVTALAMIRRRSRGD